MGDYSSEQVGITSPETLFLILILLLSGTFGSGGRKRRYDE